MLAAPDGRWSWVASPRRCRSLVREGAESFLAAGLPMTRDRTSTCLELSNIAGAPPARHHVGARGRHRRPRAADPNQTGGERRGVTRDVVVIHDLYR